MLRKVLHEFKLFASRGNVIDMSIGIVIGASFGRIANSLVKDIIMPPLGLILGKVDLANLFIVLKQGSGEIPYHSLSAARAAGAVTINIGAFLNTIVSFFIVAFCAFLLIKAINSAGLAEIPTKANCPFCLSKIPAKAVRCPHCTSKIEAQEQEMPGNLIAPIDPPGN